MDFLDILLFYGYLNNMDLQEFATKAVESFENKQDFDARIAAARKLAEFYEFSRPELVLLYTHPENVRLSLSDRCKKLNITEEELMWLTQEPGFRRFLQDFQNLALGNLRNQAIASSSIAVTQDRFSYTKNGDQIPDHKLEIEILKAMAQEKQSTNVNVQVNNVWAEGFKLANRQT